MADISLKAYLEKVDTLLKTGKYDEVIAHSQHILKHYPRNVGANRLLGQALAQGTSAEESKTVLRRVLAAYPDDVIAHVSLSEASERTGKPEEAIWHMERAFEQTPGDQRLMQRLRELYQRHRGIENPKLQLTTSAVARQYIRNGLFNQALETLHTSLERSPKRADLRLLLAQTLWTAGNEVESAETALDVLETLPYCVEANRILTRLWLDEGRPSDAQRYLEQIQEVEPYLALQLAQNAVPADDAFQLPELDYQRIAEANLATQKPDWLLDIDAPSETGADLAGAMLPADESEPAADLADLGEETEIAPPEAMGHSGMTGLLTALDNPDVESEITGELPDWLDEEMPAEAISTELASGEFDNENLDDALDWLQAEDQESGDDEDGLPDFFNEVEAEAEAVTGDDSLAWLEGSEVELVDEDEHPEPQFDDGSMAVQSEAGDDPLAWLEGSGVELADEDELPESEFVNDDDMTFHEPTEADSLAWLEGSEVELADDTQGEVAPPTSAETDDALAWLEGGESNAPDLFGDLNGEETGDALPQSSGDESDSDSLNWLNDDSMLDEFLDLENLSETEEQIAAPSAATGDESTLELAGEDSGTLSDAVDEPAEAELDWQDTMSEQDQPQAEQPESDDSSGIEWEASAGEDGLDWLTEDSDDEAEWLREDSGEIDIEASAGEEPGWLAEESSQEVDTEFSWLNETDEAIEEIGTAVTAPLPGARFADEEADTSDETTDSGDFDWMASDDTGEETEISAETTELADDGFDWLGSDETGEEAEAQPAADMPDWLSEAAPVAETTDSGEFDGMSGDDEAGEETEISAETTELADDGFDWLSSDETGEEAEAQPAADMPDWLSEAAPVAESEADTTDSDEFDWMSSDEETSEEAEAQPAADMPDWLSEAAPVAETETETTNSDEFDWMAGDEETGEEAEAQPAADMPDWLSEVAPVAETEADTTDSDEFDWMAGDEETGEEAEAQPAADMPDWLSETETVAESEGVSDEFDWSDEGETVTDTETPDWLSEVAAVDAEVDEAGAEEAEIESEALESASDIPDWLSEAAPDTDSAGEAEEEQAFDWAAEQAEPVEETAAEMPEWLAETDAGDEVAEEGEFEIKSEMTETFDAPVAETGIDDSDEFAWSADEPVAEGETTVDWSTADSKEAEFSMADDEEALEFDTDPAHSTFGWLDDSEEEQAEVWEPAEIGEMTDEALSPDDLDMEKTLASADSPPPATNAPDWLNAMVPGLDLDYEATEDDEPLDTGYDESPARREQPEELQEAAEPARNIDWLVEIVDEETGPVTPITDVEAAPHQRRFVFTRQPAWLRVPTESTSDDTDDDFELPEWLQ